MLDNSLTFIIVCTFIVLTVAVVWGLVTLLRTLQRVDEMIVNTERELTPLLANLREASEQIRTSVNHLQKGAHRAENLLDAVGEIGDSVRNVNNFLRSGTSQYLQQGMALWAGFQAFRKYFKQPQESKGE
jgi:uncharacterized protein YoxC